MNALMRIPKEEGVLTLWKGAGPTVVRAVVLNLGMLAPFDEAKEQLMKYHGLEKETVSIRVQAALVSGFLASFMSLPFDNAKVKMQKMAKLPDGTYPYKNIFDTLLKTV